MIKLPLILLVSLLLTKYQTSEAVDTLSLLGQTPGGSAFQTEFKDGRLYAGVGTSLWIYDAEDVSIDTVLARRKFMSIVNDIVVRDDSVLFVASNHDGLWAFDARNLPDLPPMAHLETPGDTAAFDIALMSQDTLYLVDGFCVRILHFTGNDFEEVTRFGEGNPTGIDIKGERIVICKREGLRGVVELFNKGNPPELVSSFDSSILYQVERVYFADLRDDIVYVCAGTANLGLTGQFFALKVEPDTLVEVAHYTINGNPLIFTLASITDLDSRNDTLFLVTTGGVMPSNNVVIDCPVLDATHLPDSMPVIGHIKPGLWYFDVAIHDSLFQLAIASEWYGIRWMDISGLQSGDTLFDDSDTIAVHPTGGWGKRAKIINDTLWLAWEGYGVGIFDLGDLSDPIQIGRVSGPFATDLVLFDTLIFVAKSSYDLEVFNLSPWYQGGEPEFVTRIDAGGLLDWVMHLASLMTDVGPRIVYQAGDSGFFFVDPRDCPNFNPVGPFFTGSTVEEFMAFGDTLFVAYDNRIAAIRVTGDSLVVLADTSVATLGKSTALGREGNLVAVSGKLNSKTARIYNFTGNSFEFLAEWSGDETIEDLVIKDSLIYVALGTGGLAVLENPEAPVEVAVFPGSGGRGNQFGAMAIDIGPDNKIYLADYNAGCFILSPVDLNVKEGSSSVIGNSIPLLEVLPTSGNSVVIKYAIPNPGKTTLKVYNVSGQLVDLIHDGYEKEGIHTVFWEGRTQKGSLLPSGIYFINLKIENHSSKTEKILLLRE